MSRAFFDIFAFAAFSDYLFGCCCFSHDLSITPYFFLFAMVFAGPFLVLAFVFVL